MVIDTHYTYACRQTRETFIKEPVYKTTAKWQFRADMTPRGESVRSGRATPGHTYLRLYIHKTKEWAINKDKRTAIPVCECRVLK